MSRLRIYGETSGYLEMKAPDVAGDAVVEIPNQAIATEAYVQLQLDGIESGTRAVDSIQFDLVNGPEEPAKGQLVWNVEDGALSVGLDGGTILQIGEETLFRVKNQTGSPIAEGAAVGFAGTLGQSGVILAAPFIADGSQPSTNFMGIATQAIADGEDGYVTHFGKVRGLDLTGIADETILYVSSTVAGGLTSTPPTAPNNIIQVAAVIKGGDPGTLFVRPTIGSNIFKDEAVGASKDTIGDGDVLAWDDAAGVFDSKSLTTTDISEGTNLYYTDARVQAIAAPLYFTEEVKSDTDYQLSLGDQAKVIVMDNNIARTLTVPQHAAAEFPVGTVINVFDIGPARTTISPGSGVTILHPLNQNTYTLADQYTEVSLRKRSTTEWVLSGNVE